jgi:uncharacterized SAM-binding protein YcdF (DUF218 family)
MFIYLSKLLPPLVYPLGLACLLLLAVLLLRKTPGARRWQTGAAVLALLVLWGASTRWVSEPLARSLEWQNLPAAEIPSADAIVVLGGATDPPLPPRTAVELNGAADRLLYAARLYKAGKAPHVLLSGGSIDWMEPGSAGSSPASQMAEIMTFIGLPADALWLEEKSLNTYENAVYSSQILQENGVKRILLVTSALHMPRALALFQHQGLEVIAAPTDFSVTEASWQGLTQGSPGGMILNLLPGTSSLSMTTNVLKEYIGMFVYHLRGWM